MLDTFVPMAMMVVDMQNMQNQMQYEQLLRNDKPLRKFAQQGTTSSHSSKIFSSKIPQYNGFREIWEEDRREMLEKSHIFPYDDREIVDVMTGERICYFQVEEDNSALIVRAEIRKGYISEEDVREIILETIKKAYKNGVSQLRFCVGTKDEMAQKTLKMLGFVFLESQKEGENHK